uniref:Small ribosomal subunit protein eS6 n=1 Tax=Zonotrichia albicollis TaxID=44394 RepID=A0A8D2MM70_ZONAL
MKLNISFPATGCQKTFYGKKMATEVVGDSLSEENKCPRSHSDSFGEEWEGYVIWISGGNDKGFSRCPASQMCLSSAQQGAFLLSAQRNWREKAQIHL